MKGRARLLRYASWQALDFVLERAVAIALILGLFLYLATLTLSQREGHGQTASAEMLRMLAPQLISSMLQPTWIMVGLIAANGISANDRTTGRFRFLFAKPLRVDAFYAQAFVVNTLLATALLLIAVLLLSAWTAATADLRRDALLVAACGVAGVSGLCFFFSAIWRFDWLATSGLWGVVEVMYVRFPGARWLPFLPPMHVVEEQIGNIAAHQAVESWPLIRFLLFGLLCFAAGLIILRRRPLST